MSNILIIENQRYEYEKIFTFLSTTLQYAVFPENGNGCFTSFMNYIHIIISTKYENAYRNKAIDYLIEYLDKKSIYNAPRFLDQKLK